MAQKEFTLDGPAGGLTAAVHLNDGATACRSCSKVTQTLAARLGLSRPDVKVNPELATFAQRGGFEAEDIMFQAQVEKAFLEIAKLRSEVKPGLYDKIVKILEPLAQLAGVAADIFWG